MKLQTWHTLLPGTGPEARVRQFGTAQPAGSPGAGLKDRPTPGVHAVFGSVGPADGRSGYFAGLWVPIGTSVRSGWFFSMRRSAQTSLNRARYSPSDRSSTSAPITLASVGMASAVEILAMEYGSRSSRMGALKSWAM